MIPFNNLSDPKALPLIQKSIQKVIHSNQFILGEQVRNFEQEFAKYLGVKFCIGVGNGFEALQISLMCLGIDKDDEVITTPISAVATTQAILAVGAKPVFVDTNQNGLINIDLIPKAITKKTKAILPVHLYGQAIDLGKLNKLCHQFKLPLIEDAAQAHGSLFKNRQLGTFGLINAFSFYPTKNLGGFGDGGAITTNSQKLALICQQIRNYGEDSKYHHIKAGLNSRLDEIQAAVLRVKLKSLDKNNQKRKILALRYFRNLEDTPSIELLKTNQNSQPNFHIFILKTKQRDKLALYLSKKGVQVSIHYPRTIPDQPFLKNHFQNLEIPEARKFVKEVLSLPIYPLLQKTQVDYICQVIRDFFVLDGLSNHP